MSSRKVFYVLAAIVILINSMGLAAIVIGEKLLQKQNTKLTELKVEANTIEQVQTSLIRAKKDIDKYSNLEQIANTVVPQEKDQARTVREIVKLAEESGIAIASVGFPSSSLGNKATGTAPTASTSGVNTQTQKVEGISNVERLEITVTSDTSQPVLYTDFLRFLEALENNRRTSQVSNINIQPTTDNRNFVTFTLIVNVYIKK